MEKGDHIRLTIRKHIRRFDRIMHKWGEDIEIIILYGIITNKNRFRSIAKISEVNNEFGKGLELKISKKWVSTLHNDKPTINDFKVEIISESAYLAELV